MAPETTNGVASVRAGTRADANSCRRGSAAAGTAIVTSAEAHGGLAAGGKTRQTCCVELIARRDEALGQQEEALCGVRPFSFVQRSRDHGHDHAWKLSRRDSALFFFLSFTSLTQIRQRPDFVSPSSRDLDICQECNNASAMPSSLREFSTIVCAFAMSALQVGVIQSLASPVSEQAICMAMIVCASCFILHLSWVHAHDGSQYLFDVNMDAAAIESAWSKVIFRCMAPCLAILIDAVMRPFSDDAATTDLQRVAVGATLAIGGSALAAMWIGTRRAVYLCMTSVILRVEFFQFPGLYWVTNLLWAQLLVLWWVTRQ